MAVVVVESPAKAKTINKYLGPGYTVLASYGHVRDLPAKDGSVNPDDGFHMTWEIAPESRKHVRAIAEALKTDDALILATDPDREGEAISWHLQEALAPSLKKGKTVSRVTFNAITKSAVTEAMKNPRQVDGPLVEAYLARRALDYLVGFTLSPVLWRKLPGAKSAGRVQSVCLRLIVEREMEIEAFRAREYWSVEAALTTPRGQTYTARLVSLGGKKLDKFDIATAAAAEIAVQAVASRALTVQSVEAKPASRNPWPPFMTSTLQQEASRKLGLGAKQCMNAAQRLYEAGHITYMRTDGIDMAPEAVMAARAEIKDRFGAAYVPDSPRMYKNKAKNAQEAHECIRPTEMSASPENLLHVTEFVHPRAEEIAGMLPARLGAWLSARPKTMRFIDRWFCQGRHLRSDRLWSYAMFYAIAGLSRWRRGTLRHAEERAHLDRWLGLARHYLPQNYDLAVEILRCRRLIKGYSDTHSRGQSKFDLVIATLPLIAPRPDAADWIRRLREAALQDEEGKALDGALRTIASFT